MKELDIKLSYNCNNNCLFCLNKEKKFFSYTTEELKKQIKDSAEKGCQRLIISGGEPLINGSFFKIIQYAKKCNIPFYEIQTNGRMLFYEDIVVRIKNICQNVSFLVSFHYYSPEMYKKYSQADGFYQVLEGLKNLKKHNLNFTTNTVLFKKNVNYLNRILDILDEVGCKSCQFRFIDGHNIESEFFDFVPRMEEAVAEIKKIIHNYPGINIYVHDIPFCVLGEDLSKNISPFPSKERENLNIKKEVLTSLDIVRSQFIYPNCQNCLLKDKCVGVRKSYLKFYGNKEFNPIV